MLPVTGMPGEGPAYQRQVLILLAEASQHSLWCGSAFSISLQAVAHSSCVDCQSRPSDQSMFIAQRHAEAVSARLPM